MLPKRVMVPSEAEKNQQSVQDLFNSSRRFRQAVSHVPPCEIYDLDEEVESNGLEAHSHVTTLDKQKLVAYCRWNNRICSQCQNKGKHVRLTQCRKCYLVCYCSTRCQEKHSHLHKQWCCRGKDAIQEANDPYHVRVYFNPDWATENIPVGAAIWYDSKGQIRQITNRTCHVCKNQSTLSDPLQRCSKCRSWERLYCTRECFMKDWPNHKEHLHHQKEKVLAEEADVGEATFLFDDVKIPS